MQGISAVAKASSARDFFASFFGLSKKEENEGKSANGVIAGAKGHRRCTSRLT
jgi:hypothetical protein